MNDEYEELFPIQIIFTDSNQHNTELLYLISVLIAPSRAVIGFYGVKTVSGVESHHIYHNISLKSKILAYLHIMIYTFPHVKE